MIPRNLHWLFWNLDVASLDVERDADTILALVLERGRLEDVRWLVDTYGLDRIHEFFRRVGHPELSPRTLSFWRAVFRAEDETWASVPQWRQHSKAPWIG